MTKKEISINETSLRKWKKKIENNREKKKTDEISIHEENIKKMQ